MKPRTRFAPSPTGYLHVGGARTALFNYLFARKHGGTFVLRVEDTDKERNTDEATQVIFTGMRWLGMEWDEGPEAGRENGPYYQSQRNEIYEKWFSKLQEKNRVYKEEGAWRFRFERKPMTMNDLICGEVTIDYTNEENTPDMVVRRSDGSFTFHFVNVIDDLEMQITHVIRGEDHLMNTPKHIQLFNALEVEPPKYAHLPLIQDMEGAKMSKRHAAAAVDSYAPRGYTSEAVFNFLALLGWSPKSEQEIFSKEELIEAFSLENVNRSPAKFDEEKCAWMNQQHLMQVSAEDFATLARPYAEEANLQLDDRYAAAAASIQEKVRVLTEVPQQLNFYFEKNYPLEEEALAKVKKNTNAVTLLTELKKTWQNLDNWSEAGANIGATAKANGAKPGQLMFPTRVALTGAAGGPDLGAILEILGKEECLRRLDYALAQLNLA